MGQIRRTGIKWIATLALLPLILACENLVCTGPDCDPGIQWRYYLVGLKGQGAAENFIVWTADTSLIRQVEEQLALPSEQRTLHVNGALLPGTSDNSGWSWHFDPNDWVLTQVSIELCDGTPSMVESDLDYWINTVGRFCPWSSYIKEELDL